VPVRRADLGQAVETYLDRLRLGGCAEGTLRGYQQVLGAWLRSGGDLGRFLPGRLAPATQRRRYAVLAAFGRWAVTANLLTWHPLEGVPSPPLPPLRPRAVPADALARPGRRRRSDWTAGAQRCSACSV
jgi:hypothetical protein